MNRPAPSSPVNSTPASSRERLLDAAAEVFAREGLRAATTREIAQVAGVNEVTLFRLFQSKQNLLTSVLEQVFAEPPVALPRKAGSAIANGELAEILQEYVAHFSARISRNLSLLRVLMGEIQHFQEHEVKVIRGIFLPERQLMIDRLRAGQDGGLVRRDVDPVIVADQLKALVFMATLRCALPLPREYTDESYLDACVKMIVRSIEVPARKVSPRPAGVKRRRKA